MSIYGNGAGDPTDGACSLVTGGGYDTLCSNAGYPRHFYYGCTGPVATSCVNVTNTVGRDAGACTAEFPCYCCP